MEKKNEVITVDESLFNYGGYNQNREYNFINLLGENQTYFFSDEEHLIRSNCPICDTYLVAGFGYMDKWVTCPCCGEDTRDMTKTKYKANIMAQIKEREADIKRLIKYNNKDVAILASLTKKQI